MNKDIGPFICGAVDSEEQGEGEELGRYDEIEEHIV